MDDVDFCCVIKPASKPLPVQSKTRPAKSAKCKKCASLKQARDQLAVKNLELFTANIRVIGERNAIKERFEKATKEREILEKHFDDAVEIRERITNSIQRQNAILAAVNEQCSQFLKNLDGIQHPYFRTPEEVEKEVRQRCVNHMITIRNMISTGICSHESPPVTPF